MNEKKNPERFGIINPDFIPLNRKTKDMATKVHFLSIPSEEFAKILTYPSLGYLSQITTKYTWNHFTGWKVSIMEEYPAEMIGQLIIHNISYHRSIVYLHQSQLILP